MLRFIIAALLCSSLSFSAAAVPPTAAPSTNATSNKIHPKLTAQMNKSGTSVKMPVIISLEAHVPPGRNRAHAIQEAQGKVLAAFSRANGGRGLSVRTRYQTLFGFSARLTKGQINALSRRGDITLIEQMPVHEKLYPESFPLTGVDNAHTAYDGTGAVIAVIDDGIDANHVAFSGKLLGGYDFADNDSNPTIDCPEQSHGTAVAGVALGNGGGALGVAPGAAMVFLKIQSADICGANALDGDIIGAIDWVTANKDVYGIDIINMSLGGGTYSSASACDDSSSLYFNAIRNATAAGITIIAAAGNNGLCAALSRPACFSEVISVGATFDESNGERWGWCISSSSCATTQAHSACASGTSAGFQDVIADDVIVYSNSADFLNLVAPATCATTAAPDDGATSCFGGTSSAAPFTTGVAALAVESAGKGALLPAALRAILSASGNDVVDPKNGRVTPRVNGDNAVVLARDSTGGDESPVNRPPVATFTFSCSNLDCEFDGTASSDPDGDALRYQWFSTGGGLSATEAIISHRFPTAGVHQVTLIVSDPTDSQDSDSQSVSVDDGVAEASDPTLHIASITVSTVAQGKGASARATVMIEDELGAPVPSVRVTGNFTGKKLDEAGKAATTDASGSADLRGTRVKRGNLSFTFCVTDVQGTATWDGAATCATY